VTQAREADAVVEASCIVVVLGVETSAQEAAVARDSATLRVKDAKNYAAQAEGVALEKVSGVEAQNAMALASAREDAKDFLQKIALLEGELAAERQAQEVSKREC
jgi:hypothetical protein